MLWLSNRGNQTSIHTHNEKLMFNHGWEFNDLPQEYWRPHILFEIEIDGGFRSPLMLDEAMQKCFVRTLRKSLGGGTTNLNLFWCPTKVWCWSFYAAIYARTSYLARRNLWVDLNRLQTKHSGPWIFVGDFNAALGAHEKCTRRLPSKISCEDCLLWTNANKLLHLRTTTTTGVRFTWDNSRFVLSPYLWDWIM